MSPAPDRHGNVVAVEGCTRCACGAKYWEHDVCVSCGAAAPETLTVRLERAQKRLWSDRDWYEQCGGSLEAYIAGNGDPGLSFCVGDGGTAMHAADLAAVARAEAQVAALEDQLWFES